MHKTDKSKFKIYLKTFEDFNKQIPDELKSLFKKIKDIIGVQKTSFKKQINLKDLEFSENILDIDVKFSQLNNGIPYHKKDIIYYSNINIYDIISYKDIINIPIFVQDININIDKLISVISHEIRHLYDALTLFEESDLMDFGKSLLYQRVKSTENNNDFLDFLFLIYLSLEHELIARNTMIWTMFHETHCSKDILYKLFEDSFMYESLDKLTNFDYSKLLIIPNIIDKVNNFINYFGGNICNNNDVLLFFKNWESYFDLKSTEYKKEAYQILDEIYVENIKENNKKTKNIKNILLQIHNDIIMKK